MTPEHGTFRDEPRRRQPARLRALVAGSTLAVMTAGISVAAEGPGATLGCSFEEARADESGRRRLALLVGVGRYANPEVTPLVGPASDVRSMHELLTGPNGYGFPTRNVCVLLDERATSEAFAEAWEKALVARARPDDVAVFFFAGHGSQARDWNGDEPDGYDETLMLHDARHRGRRDLIDDELNRLVSRLYAKTTNVTVILDSCNSGTASRGGSRARARFFDRLDDEPPAGAVAAGGDGGEGWEPESMPGLVVLSAARDGSSAIEIDGAGVFTQSLVAELGEVGSAPLTYAQVSHRVPQRLAAQSQQVAYFQGDLQRVVFGATRRERPASWVVRSLEEDGVRLQGVPMPGWSKGALLRVHAGSSTLEEVRDASNARGFLELEEIGGFDARASYVVEEGAPRPELEPGDLAILVQAGEGATTISVRLRPPGEEGGLGQRRIDALRRALEADPEAAEVVEWDESGGFEVAVGSSGDLQILGPEGRVRNSMEPDAADASVIQNLALHADQKAFLGLKADPGSIFENDSTLQVRIVENGAQTECARGNLWLQAERGREQLIPMCHRWDIEVTLSETSPKRLLIGGVVLWNDGSKEGFPEANESVLLEPGQLETFPVQQDGFFESLPPLGVPEHILVFGTQEGNPVAWGDIHSEARTRGKPKSPLARLIAKYFKGKRGGRKSVPTDDALLAWTSTHVVIRAEANVFARPDSSRLAGQPAELASAFAVSSPDLRPYAPANEEAALYRVLEQAVALTDPESTAGAVRPVLSAFANAGLAVPGGSPRIAELADRAGVMAADFAPCELVELRTGDLVVQEDEAAGAGHLSLVLDPAEHVVWGALGWAGAASPIAGVGFHHQRSPRDWKLWGLDGMRQAACWRHKELLREAADPSKRPGSRLPLDPDTVCGDEQGGGCPTIRLFREP